MSRYVRQSAQLARLAQLQQRNVLYKALRPSAARSFLTQRSCAAQSRQLIRPRHYSTDPSRRPDEDEKTRPHDGTSKDINQTGESTEPLDLPPGWVRLTEDELKQLGDFRARLPAPQQKVVTDALEGLRRTGAPENVRDLLLKMRTGTGVLGILDMGKMMYSVFLVAERLAEVEAKEGSRANLSSEESKDDLSSSFFQKSSKAAKDSGAQQDAQSNKQQERQLDNEEGKRQQTEKDGEKGSTQGKPDGDGQGAFYTSKKPGQEGPEGAGAGKPGGPDNWIQLALLSTILLLSLEYFMGSSFTEKEITWQEMRKEFLDKGLVQKLVVINGKKARVELHPEAVPNATQGGSPKVYTFTIGSVQSFEKNLDEAQDQLGIPPTDRIPVSYEESGGGLGNLVFAFGPTLLFIGLILWTQRSMGGGRGGAGGMFSFGKSKARKFNAESAVKVKFNDVAGLEEAKVEIMEFVSFLKQPEKFEKLGAKIPRGAILAGPPGTGKTLLAKATAGESGVPFFSVSGSEFVEMFVGVGPSRVRDLFAEGRKNAPCIIFIDEIDAIGRARQDSNRGFGGNDEREATLNQILTEMDGFNTREQVVVLAGTNRADVLDKALMRPGRFDRHIYIDRPTMKGRQEIFHVYLKKIVTKEDTEHLVGRLATLTPGFSGADISNVVNEAALIAARQNADDVKMEHFERAIERVVGGLERKSLVLKPEEKKTVAYHEAGHAICGWYFEHADPLLKVSIIPRGQGALGYAQYLPQDAYLMNTNQLMDRMAMTMGGRVSEELHFPTVTTGASDDFKKVSQMARNMVTQWGMSEKVGRVHFENDPNRMQKPFAESTAQQIDQEVSKIVEAAYQKCKDLLTEKKKEVGVVAEELLKKEVLTRDDMVRLLGKRPFDDNEDFEKYFGGGKEESSPPPFPGESGDSPQEPPTPSPAFKDLPR